MTLMAKIKPTLNYKSNRVSCSISTNSIMKNKMVYPSTYMGMMMVKFSHCVFQSMSMLLKLTYYF